MEQAIRAGRSVGLNAIETAVAVLGLRREMSGALQRWTLGTHGTFEMDSQFVGLTLSAQSCRGDQRIETTGRLWSPDGMAVVSVAIALESALAPPTQVSITVASLLPPTFAHDLVGLRTLAHAALAELCEEVLFHAANARAHTHDHAKA